MSEKGIKTKLDGLPINLKREVLDYIEFLLQKYGKEEKNVKFKFDCECISPIEGFKQANGRDD